MGAPETNFGANALWSTLYDGGLILAQNFRSTLRIEE